MLKKVTCLFLCIFLLTSFIQSSHVAAREPIQSAEKSTSGAEQKVYSTATLAHNFSENHVLVVMTNQASLSFQDLDASDFSEVKIKSVKNLMPYTENRIKEKVALEKSAALSTTIDTESLTTVSTKDYHQIFRLELNNPGKENVLAAIKILEQRSDVLCAEPDYYLYASADPDDTYRDDQWAINKISLPNAWNVTTGSNSVSVGIIDSGIATNHPDLAGRVDSTLSKSFVSGSTYSTDSTGHGTQVAGVIAAKTNNTAGISGVCWNIKLVSLKVTSGDYAMLSVIAEAIDHAEGNGISILNCSYGSKTDNAPAPENVIILRNSINNYSGLFVCSAGNAPEGYAGTNLDIIPIYPAAIKSNNTICVGASTNADTIRFSSHYGKNTVDIFAPGEGILTTAICLTGCSACSTTPGYHSVSGTSFAAPYVAGVAALIKSKYPSLTAAQIKDRIMNSVSTPMQNGQYVFEDLCVSGGRLNAYSAVHNHTLTATDNQDGYTHNVHCSSVACFYHYSEDHAFTVSGVGFECDDCGYYTELLPYAFDNSEIS